MEEVRGSPMLVPVGPVSSATASTDPLHPNAMASQRSPNPTAPAGEGEGGTTEAGGFRGAMWGNVRRETRGDVAGGVRTHKRRHRRGQRSRYRRMHVEGDIAGDRAGNGSCREARCGGRYLRGTVAVGTHTGAGTPLKELWRMEDPGWSRKRVRRKEQGKKRVRNQEQQQETITYRPNLLHCPLLHIRDRQGLSVTCGQNRGRGGVEGRGVGVRLSLGKGLERHFPWCLFHCFSSLFLNSQITN